MELLINGLGGSICTIIAESEWPIEDVKRVIEKRGSIPKEEQRLLVGSRELQDTERVKIITSLGPPPTDHPSAILTVIRRTPDQMHWRRLMRQQHLRCDAPAHIRTDSDVLIEAFKYNSIQHLLKWMDVAKLQDRAFVITLLRSQPLSKAGSVLAHADPALCSDREVIEVAVRNDPVCLHMASLELQGDRDIVLSAVRGHGIALQHASLALRGDPEVVLAAFQSWCQALRFCPDQKLQNTRDFILALLRAPLLPSMLRRGAYNMVEETVRETMTFASEVVRDDDEVISTAVAKHGLSLRFASERLRGDRAIVMIAISQDSFALEYASKELRSDVEVVLAAVQKKPTSFRFAQGKPLRTRHVVLAAVAGHGPCLKYASKSLRSDHEVVSVAIKEQPRALEFAMGSVPNDRSLVLSAISKCGRCLAFSSPGLRADRFVVQSAIIADPLALKHASDELKNNQNIVRDAISRNADAFCYASPALRGNRKIALKAISKNWRNLASASAGLRDNKTIVLAAIAKSYHAVEYASERLKTDSEIMRAIEGRRRSGRTPIVVVRALNRKKKAEKAVAQAKAVAAKMEVGTQRKRKKAADRATSSAHQCVPSRKVQKRPASC